MSNTKNYLVVNGISYDARTSAAVIRTLEEARQARTRVRIFYGDAETGQDWGERADIAGRIGNSMGPVKIPLLIYNARSMGGGALLDHCIVKITTSAKPHRVLYQHPTYKPPVWD